MPMTSPPAGPPNPPDLYIVLDAVDTDRVAGFWAAALRYRRVDRLEKYEILAPPAGDAGPLLLVQGVAEAKEGKNRMHLDLHVDDPDAEVERLTGLGARRVSDGGIGSIRWTTMADPEGNELCIGQR